MNMNADSIEMLSVFCYCFADTVINIVNLQIFSAEIRGITIAESIVSTGYGIAFDAIAGCKSQLHSIIGHKIMITAPHDFV